MIERYSRKEMARIWEPENRYQTWLDVELAACEAWAKKGRIPKAALARIKKKARFDVARIDEIEREVKHDVIAFLTSVADYVGTDSRYIHIGLTSSDILDTSLAMLLKQSAELIIEDIKKLLVVIKKRAIQHKKTVMVGRSHGIHAEPTTFGLKMALFYDETARNLERMERARDAISCGQLSGAVGTFANVDPAIERETLKRLGLKPAAISTQVVQRDIHAEFFNTLALVATGIEKFSIEVRHLQRTEVLEVEEPFTKGQKGSSAMPHKRNPVLTENMTGLARLVRGYSHSAMENIPLWHERDISHSSVERIIAPDATILVDFMLNRMIGLVKGLVVYPENMKENLGKLRGLIFSQGLLLGIAAKGLSREEAYSVVQRAAMKVWDGLGDSDGPFFKDVLLSDKRVTALMTKKEIEACFDLKPHLKNVDYIFNRVFPKIKPKKKR